LSDKEKNDPSIYIRIPHVVTVRKTFYTNNINNIEDLNKPPYSSTLDNGPFLQYFILRPTFLMLYSSEYQLNLMRKYQKNDQIYVDGTFHCVPP